jgi:hypothetical protein
LHNGLLFCALQNLYNIFQNNIQEFHDSTKNIIEYIWFLLGDHTLEVRVSNLLTIPIMSDWYIEDGDKVLNIIIVAENSMQYIHGFADIIN